MRRRNHKLSNMMSLLVAFVATSMVSGLLAAGVAVPVVGGAGMIAKQAVGTFDALPRELTTPVLAQQTRILANDGTELATLYEENRTVVPMSQIAPIIAKAQIAVEDDRYYEHGGVDTRGLLRAVVATLRGDTQGGSTITQQYVRRSLVTNALREGDNDRAAAAEQQRGLAGIVRKMQEIKYAIELEKRMSKDQILEGYLNLVYYGAQSYGVEAASMRYFGIHAKDLNLNQAATIAGLAQRPGVTDPITHYDAALARRNEVLVRMAQSDAITDAQVTTESKKPITLDPQPLKASCESAVDKWVCLYVRSWLTQEVPSLGQDMADRQATLMRGGLTIKTSFDVNLLKQTREILTSRVPSRQEKDVGAAAAVVEPGTGRVLAIAQSSADSTDVIWSVDSEYGQSGGFHIGSTAKTYAIVEALKQGKSRSSMVYAAPSGTTFYANQFRASDCGINAGPWTVRNVEGTVGGAMSLGNATMWSVNTAFADLATKIGICGTKATMKQMGLHQADGEDYGTGPASIVLGSDNASPLTMALSYATLPAGGNYCQAHPVDSITTYDGQQLALPAGTCRDTDISPRVAYDTTQILRTVPGWSGVPFTDGRQVAAKSGTSDESVHTWFIGFTPQRSTAVWVGRPNYWRSMEGVNIGGRYFGQLYGATLAGPLWREIMQTASKDLPKEPFRIMSPDSGNSKQVVPDLRGDSRQEAISTLQSMKLNVEIGERVSEEGLGWDQVARTDPAAGSEVAEGETVTLTVASGWWPGQQPAPRPAPPQQAPPRQAPPRQAPPRQAPPSQAPAPRAPAPTRSAPSTARPGTTRPGASAPAPSVPARTPPVTAPAPSAG
ncbi:MAG: transglycosylase domain-containing protein [Dermatophilaceae bacterium]